MKRIILYLFVVLLPTVCFSMADYENPPVYGRPTLYGEYELSADDVRRARSMYGDAPQRAAPIVAPAARAKPQAKHPIRPKATARGATKKKVHEKAPVKKVEKVKKEKPQDIQVATEKITEPSVKVVKDADIAPVVAAPRPAPQADKSAVGIADKLGYKLDVESYCTIRRAPYSGPLPDGIILMPGRTDLMSCIER